MNRVRVLAGTRKGAFILTSDEARQRWDIQGPFFGGWEIFHVNASPADPDRLYASQTSDWFGQIIQRSSDGGRTWEQPGTPPGEPTTTPDGMPRGESNKFVYDTSPETGKPLTTHQWYDGTPHPWEFKRVWHLEPSPTDPDTVYAGVEDAALFRTTDGAQSRHEQPALRGHGSGPQWQPGAGGMCLHTVLLDSAHPERITAANSAAGAVYDPAPANGSAVPRLRRSRTATREGSFGVSWRRLRSLSKTHTWPISSRLSPLRVTSMLATMDSVARDCLRAKAEVLGYRLCYA
jgi:hypothetical protein